MLAPSHSGRCRGSATIIVARTEPGCKGRSRDDDADLRTAMGEALQDYLDDPDLTADAEVVDLVGDPASRLRRPQAMIVEG